MGWLTTLLRYIKVSTVVGATLCTPAVATTYYDKCIHSYTNTNFSICSEKLLSSTDLKALDAKYKKSLRIFPNFIKSHGYELKDITVPLTIYLLPHSTLNDQSLFSRDPWNVLYGRYRDNVGQLYVSYDALLNNNTDLVHELAHYFNNNIGYVDREDNEKIAVDFEKYYVENQ